MKIDKPTPLKIMKEFFAQHGVRWTYVDEQFWAPLDPDSEFIFSQLYLEFMAWYSNQPIEGRDTDDFLRLYRKAFPNGVS